MRRRVSGQGPAPHTVGAASGAAGSDGESQVTSQALVDIAWNLDDTEEPEGRTSSRSEQQGEASAGERRNSTQSRASSTGPGASQPRGSSVSEEIASRLAAKANIDDLLYNDPVNDRALLRATSSSEILRKCCLVMGKEECRGDYWGKSWQVRQVNTFVSHNWSTSRWDKYLVLSLYFNGVPALLLACLASAMCFACVWTGLLAAIAPWCSLAFSVTFALVVFFYHDVASALGFKGSACFLDKCCVHQRDAELKNRAIQSLAGFIHSSSEIVVIYTGIYFSRLWTMYEAASFLMVKRGKGNKFVHIKSVAFEKAWLMTFVVGVLVICIWYWLALYSGVERAVLKSGSHELEEVVSSNSLGLSVVGALFWTSLSILGKAWLGELIRMRERVDAFRVSTASCFCEEDRFFVQRNIARFMRHLGAVDHGDPDTEAHARFEQLVREEMTSLLTISFGQSGFPWRRVASACSLFFLPAVDLVLLAVSKELPWRRWAVEEVANTVTQIVFVPLALSMMSRFWRGHRILRISGVLPTALRHVAFGGTCALIHAHLVTLSDYLCQSWELLAVQACIWCTLIALRLWLDRS